MTRRRGNALVETAAAAGLAAVLITLSLALGRLALDRGRAQSVSRLAAELSTCGLPPDLAAAETADYARRLGLSGADLSTRRYLDLPSAAFYRLIAADARVSAARPAVLGGGVWSWTDRAVLEEE